MKKFAVIDIGSNSVRLMFVADGKVLYKRLHTTRLGAGLAEAPRLKTEAMARCAPVACTVEEGLLTVVEAVGVSHLKNICLAAVRPTLRLEIIAHHPECRPKTVRCLRKLD